MKKTIEKVLMVNQMRKSALVLVDGEVEEVRISYRYAARPPQEGDCVEDGNLSLAN